MKDGDTAAYDEVFAGESGVEGVAGFDRGLAGGDVGVVGGFVRGWFGLHCVVSGESAVLVWSCLLLSR